MATKPSPDVFTAFSAYGSEDTHRNLTPFFLGSTVLFMLLLFALCLLIITLTSISLPGLVVIIVPLVSTLASSLLTVKFLQLDHPAVYHRSIIVESGDALKIYRSNDPTTDDLHHYMIYLSPSDEVTMRYGGWGTPTEGVTITTCRPSEKNAIETETQEYTLIGQTRLLE